MSPGEERPRPRREVALDETGEEEREAESSADRELHDERGLGGQRTEGREGVPDDLREDSKRTDRGVSDGGEVAGLVAEGGAVGPDQAEMVEEHCLPAPASRSPSSTLAGARRVTPRARPRRRAGPLRHTDRSDCEVPNLESLDPPER